MGSDTRLVELLSLVQGSSLSFVLNFDPKFKGSENIRFTHTHGHLDSYGSMVYRTSVAFGAARIGSRGCYRVGLVARTRFLNMLLYVAFSRC